jgi:hypothetical protein
MIVPGGQHEGNQPQWLEWTHFDLLHSDKQQRMVAPEVSSLETAAERPRFALTGTSVQVSTPILDGICCAATIDDVR